MCDPLEGHRNLCAEINKYFSVIYFEIKKKKNVGTFVFRIFQMFLNNNNNLGLLEKIFIHTNICKKWEFYISEFSR